MDCELKNRLYSLSKQSRLKDIIDLTESIVEHQPQDLAVRYCAGMAKIYAGDFAGGLAHLYGIIELYDNLLLFEEPDFETKRFVGYTALQLSQLSEFHTATKLDRSLAVLYSNKAAIRAKAIGYDIEDLALRKSAEAILRRHIVWCVKNERGGIEGGIFPAPQSPFVLQLEPTNNCQLECSMCPRRRLGRPKGFISEALLEKILNSWSGKSVEVEIPHLVLDKIVFKNAKTPGMVKLYFMGEPLLHPQIDRLVSAIRDKGVFVGIQTNGLLLKDKELRRKILAARPSGLWFSVDGVDKESFERTRKGSDWETVFKAITDLHKEREEMGLGEEIKIGITSIVPDKSTEAKRRTSEFLSPFLSLVDYIDFVDLDRRMGGAFFDPEGKQFSFKNTVLPHHPSNKQEPLCPESLEKLNVLWDGTVTPCCYDINAEMDLGNAGEKGIDAVWNSEELKRMQSALLNHRFENLALCQFCKGRFGQE